jgi:hypothetical protein
MHLEPAFLPQPQNREKTPTVETHIGSVTAHLAAVLGWTVIQLKGKPTREATVRGAQLLAELVELAMFWPSFHAMAREQGKLELRRQCQMNLVSLDGDWLDRLVEEALAMVSAVAKKVTN